MHKNVYYDANFSIGEFRGMGKYINFIDEVLTSSGFEVFPLLKAGYLLPNCLSFGFKNYILWEQFSLPQFQKKRAGIYIYPYNTAPLRFINKGSINVLILHDLIFMEDLGDSKSLLQKIGKAYRRFVVPKVVHKFDYIITVSEYSKRKIASRFNISLDKITVIPNSIDVKGDELPVVREKFIFHLGGEPDYKNTKLLIRAYAQLPEKDREEYRLKILGIKNSATIESYSKLFKELNISDKVDLLSYQTDEEVKDLYKKASLFVFTSLEEGFGIPLIEAMRYKTPLLSSSASCLPEIAGDAAIYFDPYDEKDLSNKISNILTNPRQIEECTRLGENQIQQFSEEIVREKLLKYFNKLNESTNYIT